MKGNLTNEAGSASRRCYGVLLGSSGCSLAFSFCFVSLLITSVLLLSVVWFAVLLTDVIASLPSPLMTRRRADSAYESLVVWHSSSYT